MVKKNDNRAVSALKHGRHSKTVKELQEKLDLLPLKAVEKLELQGMLDSLNARNLAFDIDTHIKHHLIEALQSTDKRLMSYMTDLGNTQLRMANLEQSLQFHTTVLQGLKERYLTCDDEDKPKVYEQIQESEKTIAMYERQVKDYLELRNKIRKEIDKGKYQSKQLELKEDEMAGKNARPIDIDYEVLNETR